MWKICRRQFSTYYSRPSLPNIQNEPMLSYAPQSPERIAVLSAVKTIQKRSAPLDIPIIVGGKEIRDSSAPLHHIVNPSNHSQVLATYRSTDRRTAQLAIEYALKAKRDWERTSLETRAAVFLKAADLLATKYRADMCAAVIVGQGKNMWQAEIDAAAEQCDFWRFNTKYAQQIYEQQPSAHAERTWNTNQYRPLEGFVLAISPFNFAAIGANLSCAPAQMGNTVLWKPSATSLLANYLTFQILREAGLPDGVINFLPGDGREVSEAAFAHSDFAGLHFTGSTATFNRLTRDIYSHLDHYRSYPRIVGETGGKNMHFVHTSADPQVVIHQTIRGTFEYSGQKCSATSRMYIPESLWANGGVRDGLVAETKSIITHHFGDVTQPRTFVGPVIDKASFTRLKTALSKVKEEANNNKSEVEILVGGQCDDSVGYFVEPTIVQVRNPHHWLLKQELFGPVLAVYVYEDAKFDSCLELADQTAGYALTGSIFARDRSAIEVAHDKLRHAAGNFYVNDKSTGAVVGQQAFGGGRQSGTNDKAGSPQNLWRWVSTRTIKETFVPLTSWRYPSLLPESKQD